jgi:predicted nucleic acid-binding protein
MRILVDTNVLLRVAEPGHIHHAQAVAAVDELRQPANKLCLVPQVHYEFWVAATRPVTANGLGMTSDEAESELKELAAPLFRLLRDERAIYDAWHALVCQYSVQGKQAHHSRLVAAMQRHGLTHILTFNVGDFKRYNQITAIDPQQVAPT